ncbi:uncharacterized protein I303_104967 [Kwoniella dejecticola CBS 10117]|uniref:Peroxisomal ATPase PEX1 n=1 Tax=Kwoniella dejecticola CBS 10117 TaxID=1296121 RepID=A0A1A6A3U8_9TREE|nr:uncharacterized protein I303_05588 [Kwoniella dejecticola CBS 10117]OBR84729.1 hypothetical protein I303_05588 [Kwoniella dejecticola CBS 10117]
MARKAVVKYRSLRSNLVHLPLCIFAQLAQQQARPQSLIIHLSPLSPSSSSSSSSRPPKPAYLGWSGLAASSSLTQAGDGVESIELDPEVALSFGWPEGTLVEISIIHNPTKARSVSVTPLTSDDWEILEQHASFLETHLLSQLRAAQKGQEIDVWVMGKTKIRIRVDETNPPTSTKEAVLLNMDTEVYVAPRPRGMSKPKEQPIDTSTTQNGSSSSGSKSKAKGVGLRLIPYRVAMAWGDPGLPDAGPSKVALCSAHTLERIRRKLALRKNKDGVAVTLVEEDQEEVPTEAEQRSTDQAGGEPSKEMVKTKSTNLQLIEWDEMPDGCVSIVGGTEEWESSWGNVKLLSKGTEKKEEKANRRKTDPSPINHPSILLFPGKHQLIADATAYLSRGILTGSNRPLLVEGNKGSGKSTVAKIIAERLETDRSVLAEPIYEDVAKLDPESRLTSLKESMTGWAEIAEKRRPCCLVLDGLDTLIGVETELNSSSNPAILADHFCRLFSSTALPSGFLVIVTATSSTALHPMLGAKHLFGEILKIPPLTKDSRQEILRILVDQQNPNTSLETQINGMSENDDIDYISLGGLTEGYSISDLVDLLGNATQQSIIRSLKAEETPHLTMDDFVLAQEAFTPLSLRGVSLQKSEVKWSDIGGLHEPRRMLRETLEWPTKYAQIFANCPLRLRSGLLLYGYPGCGKTLLASAVARECGLNFISVKGPEILNKYIGASEKAVRDLFGRASGAKPCVLFFDEFDSVAPKRGHDSTGVTDRVVNQLLTEMDGAQGLIGVYVLAATSRPDLIDPALLRPGRLDKSILCDMPSTSDRKEILLSVAKKLHFASDVEWNAVADKTEGMSGADLQAVVYNAHLEVVHSSLDQQSAHASIKEKENGVQVNGHAEERNYRQIQPVEEETSAAVRAEMVNRMEVIGKNSSRHAGNENEISNGGKEHNKPIIKYAHLLRSLESTRPSVSPADMRKLQNIYRSFASDRDGKMGDGDLGRGTGTRVSLM